MNYWHVCLARYLIDSLSANQNLVTIAYFPMLPDLSQTKHANRRKSLTILMDFSGFSYVTAFFHVFIQLLCISTREPRLVHAFACLKTIKIDTFFSMRTRGSCKVYGWKWTKMKFFSVDTQKLVAPEKLD